MARTGHETGTWLTYCLQVLGRWCFWEHAHPQRTGCVRFSSLGSSPSYLELLTCLEMAKQANELPEASKMGTSGQR
jgi:hypothetical protein